MLSILESRVINFAHTLVSRLAALPWLQTIFHSYFLVSSLSFSLSVIVNLLSFISVLLQFLVFFLELVLFPPTTAATTAVDETAQNEQDSANNTRDDDYEQVTRQKALTVVNI